MANDQVVHDLSDTDWAATSMNMQLYVNSVQISNKALQYGQLPLTV